MSKSKAPPPTLDALSESMGDFFNAISHENNLACVLVATSYLEQCLAGLLRMFFVEKSSVADSIFDYKDRGILTDISTTTLVGVGDFWVCEREYGRF